MRDFVITSISTFVSWLKTHYCWDSISFWDFSVSLFLITTFCKIVFHNYDTPEIWVDVGRAKAGVGSEYHW